MAFGFGGTSSTSKSSSTSSQSPGFGAGSMASARASDRGSVAGYSGESASSSGKTGRVGSNSTSSNTGSTSSAKSTSSSKSTPSGFSSSPTSGAAAKTGRVGSSGGLGGALGSMASARAADRASVAGYAANSPSARSPTTSRIGTATPTGQTPTAPTTQTTAKTSRLGATVANSMAAARAADRASVTGYAANSPAATTPTGATVTGYTGPRGPSNIAAARAADRASMPGYAANSPRGLGAAVGPSFANLADRMGTTPTTTVADRMGLTPTTAATEPTGLSPTAPGVAAPATGPTTNAAVPTEPQFHTMADFPDLAKAPKAPVNIPPGFTKPTSQIMDKVAASWAAVVGPENVRINATPHGGLRSKKGSGRHGPKEGHALDYGVEVKSPSGDWRSLNFANKADLSLANKVDQYGAANFGLKGYGVGNGYMGNVAIHHDDQEQPRTGVFEWSGPAATARLVGADERNARAAARASYDKKRGAVASTIAEVTSKQTPAQQAITRITSSTPDIVGEVAGVTPVTAATRPVVGAPTPVTKPLNFAATPKTGPIGQLEMQHPTPERPYQRSLTGSVVAGGIDMLAGTNPLGMVGNVASMAFLGTTLGGAVWDAAHGRWGENQASFATTSAQGGGTTDRGTTVPKAPAPAAAAETPASDFVSKYIDVKDSGWSSPAIRFNSSVDQMPLTPPKYDFESKTAPYTFRRM